MQTLRQRTDWLALLFGLAIVAGCSPASSSSSPGAPGQGKAAGQAVSLLNVSYDPTRELWKDINRAFADTARQDFGPIHIKQSHGGSSTQARAVIDGLEADVVSLALWTDTQAIADKGLISAGWEERLPHRSLPYTSTIVFVVRRGNPKQIQQWPDLVRPGVSIITPNPKTSGNGKLSFLAAWGSVALKGGSEDEARAFVTKLYQAVPVLDTGARGATTTFAQKGIGDVHLTWENEAHLEVAEAQGDLEIVYPALSILAEPHVALVDAHVDRHGTRSAAEAYLQFVYSPAGQEIVARHHYRPSDPGVLAAHRVEFPEIELFSITQLATDWRAAQEKFFAEGALFDTIYLAPRDN